VVAFSWSDKENRRRHWAQVLRIRDGRIVDMQDYRHRKHAAAAARLRARFS
jgi:ketosteroid isomerase-like protein